MTLRKTEEIFGLILVVNLKPDEWKKEKDDFSVSDTGGSEEKIRLPPTGVKPISAGPDLEVSGGGGGGGGGPPKKHWATVWAKNKGGRVPPDPSPGSATAYDLLVTSPDTLALNSSTELQENHRSCLQVSASTPPNLK